MTGRLWGDRRAEAFQNALDGHVDLTEPELVEFVQLAHALRDVPPVALGSEARDSIRAQLVAEADTVLSPGAPAPAQPRRRRRVVRTVAGSAAAAAALSGGLVAVSADALPGEVLYPIKRGVEQLELTFGGGGASNGTTHLDHASERLGEATSLAKSGGDSEQVSSALRDFTTDTRAGTEQLLRTYGSDNDRGAIDAIRSFARDSAAQLRDLAPMLGTSTDTVFTRAVAAVETADQRAIEACPTCAGGPAVQVPYMVDPIGRLDALPGRDRHGGKDNDSEQDDFLADPQNIPKGTTLPHVGDLYEDRQHDGGNGDSDTSRPKLHGGNDSDGGSSSVDEDESGPELGDGTGIDDGIADLPGIPGLPDTGDGIGGVIDLGPVRDILGPVQDLLDRLGPLGDVLDPVLGDGSDSKQDDDSKGPLDGLLGDGTRKNRGKDRGESKPDRLDPHQDKTEQSTPDNNDNSGDGQNDDEQDGPLDGLIETDEDSGVEEDGLGGLTGGDEGGTTNDGDTSEGSPTR